MTVDLKHKKMFLTLDKFNAAHHKLVMQGSSHLRPRSNGSDRFKDALNTERDGANLGLYEGDNFLGFEWAKSKGC